MKDKKRKKEREPGKIRIGRVLVWTAAIVLTAAAIAILLYLIPKDDREADSLIDGTEPFVFETEPFTEAETEGGVVPRPDIDEQLLTVRDRGKKWILSITWLFIIWQIRRQQRSRTTTILKV